MDSHGPSRCNRPVQIVGSWLRLQPVPDYLRRCARLASAVGSVPTAPRGAYSPQNLGCRPARSRSYVLWDAAVRDRDRFAPARFLRADSASRVLHHFRRFRRRGGRSSEPVRGPRRGPPPPPTSLASGRGSALVEYPLTITPSARRKFAPPQKLGTVPSGTIIPPGNGSCAAGLLYVQERIAVQSRLRPHAPNGSGFAVPGGYGGPRPTSD